MTTVIEGENGVPMRKILLSGGGHSGRVWESFFDHAYLIEVASDSGATLPPGSFSVAGTVIRPLRYNATGKFEAVGEEDLEIYEFVGSERMLVVGIDDPIQTLKDADAVVVRQ